MESTTIIDGVSFVKVVQAKSKDGGGLNLQAQACGFPIGNFYTLVNLGCESVRGDCFYYGGKQAIFVQRGYCKMTVDNGRDSKIIDLNDLLAGVVIEKNPVWRKLHDFSDDAEILVVTSDIYSEGAESTDSDEFSRLI